MTRWNAVSDLDYADEFWARPSDVTVTCSRCGELYEERGDEPPPYLCAACEEVQGREERGRQLRLDGAA